VTRRYRFLLVLAVVATVLGLSGPWAYSAFVDTSAKDRIEADPPPSLFTESQIAPLGAQVDAQHVEAHRLMRQWWRDHDRQPHDAAFVSWVEQALPGPPPQSQRDAEIREVEKLAAQRGVTAATWLEDHGKKDIWKLYAHDLAEVLPPAEGDARKNDVDALLSMTKSVADTLGTQDQQSAPYVLHPSLRTDHTVTAGQVCPCSYPSRHAAAAGAARSFLDAIDPHRDGEYRWMQDEIDYSRVYMAGHTTSDITAGTLLGDMIGEYFAQTRA